MGKRTDQAEREVVAQRERLSRMVTDLNHRVTNDAQAVGDRVADRASELQHRAGDAIEKVPGAQTLSEQIPKHPLTSMGAGLAAGMVLGMMGGRGSDGHHDDGRLSRSTGRHEDRGDNSNGGNSGLIDGIASAAITSIAIPIQREIETVAREALDGFMGRGSSKSKQEPSRTAADQIPARSDGATQL